MEDKNKIKNDLLHTLLNVDLSEEDLVQLVNTISETILKKASVQVKINDNKTIKKESGPKDTGWTRRDSGWTRSTTADSWIRRTAESAKAN